MLFRFATRACGRQGVQAFNTALYSTQRLSDLEQGVSLLAWMKVNLSQAGSISHWAQQSA
jgi:hypothetical protein